MFQLDTQLMVNDLTSANMSTITLNFLLISECYLYSFRLKCILNLQLDTSFYLLLAGNRF